MLERLGCKKAELAHYLFTYRTKEGLQGIILVWVNDIFYAATAKFEAKVMEQVAQEFLIGRSEEEAFIYNSCRTTQSCRHKALLSSSGPD